MDINTDQKIFTVKKEEEEGSFVDKKLHELVLNENQSNVFEQVKEQLNYKKEDAEKPKTAMIITGPSGTGKTTLLRYIADYVRNTLYGTVLAVATMGVTALNIQDGKTSHKAFGFPRKYEDGVTTQNCKLHKNEEFQKALRNEVSNTTLIIYDNANMEDSRKIEMLDMFLKERFESTLPFGGKFIIFAADFLQLPPVLMAHETPTNFSLKLSPIYNELFHLRLNEIFDTEEHYFNYLNEIRSTPTNDDGSMRGNMVELRDINCVNDIMKVIQFVYPRDDFPDSDLCFKRVILDTQIKGFKAINENIMNELVPLNCIREYQEVPYDGEIDIDEEDEENIRPSEPIKLWNGCICSLVRTIQYNNSERFLVGTRVIVRKMEDDVITVFMPVENKLIHIERKIFMWDNITYKQFPLELSYATTIHKASGQKFERVGANVLNIFRHGQLYQALSTVRYRKDIILLATEGYAKNIVDSRMLE